VRTTGDKVSRPRNRRRTHHKAAIVGFLLPFGVLFVLFYLVPVAYAVYQSLFKVSRGGIYGRPELVWAGLEQYQLALQNSDFWGSIGRVLLLCLVQVPVMLGLGLLFALLLDSPLVKGKAFFRVAFFVPFAVPSVVAAIIWAFLLDPTLSPFETLTTTVDFFSPSVVIWTVANVIIWMYAGYNMLIYYSALQAVPGEMYEAARIDGAGHIRIAWSIKLPMIAPTITLTGVLSIIGILQLFNEPKIFNSISSSVSSTFTPNMVVYETSRIPNYNLASALSVVLALLTFVLSFTLLKVMQRKSLA
jgi:multiple sugar transport system permease protein